MGSVWEVLVKTRVLPATGSVLSNGELGPFCAVELGEKLGYVCFLAFVGFLAFAGLAGVF